MQPHVRHPGAVALSTPCVRMLDAAIVLDAHDGSLVYEIPQEHMVIKQGASHLYVALDEAALQSYAGGPGSRCF